MWLLSWQKDHLHLNFKAPAMIIISNYFRDVYPKGHLPPGWESFAGARIVRFVHCCIPTPVHSVWHSTGAQ